MSAEEALAYGLIDEIVQPNDEKIRQLSLPPPSQSPELFNEIPKSAIDYEFGKLVSRTIPFYDKLNIPHYCRPYHLGGCFIPPMLTTTHNTTLFTKNYNFPFLFPFPRRTCRDPAPASPNQAVATAAKLL
jgi:hypothetical protein